VYPMFLASQDCPFFIAPSVFSNVYMLRYDTYDLNKMRPPQYALDTTMRKQTQNNINNITYTLH
jgi:hypothetical protein